MNTHSQNQKNSHVGDVSRPRVGPRRDGWRGGGYYVTPPTTSTTDNGRQGSSPGKPPTSAEREALAEFNRALQLAIDEVDWSQPF